MLGMGNVFGQIAERGTATTGRSANNTLNIDKPVGVQIDDLLLATIHQADNDDRTLSQSIPPSGWTYIDGSRYYQSSGSDNEWRVDYYYRIATAADIGITNYTFNGEGDADDMQGAIIAFSGIDSAQPFDVGPGTVRSNGNSSSVTANSITTVSSNTAIVMLAAVSNDRNFFNNSWSTNSPGNLDRSFEDDFNTSNLDMAISGAWEIKPNAGPTGNGTVTLNANARSGAILLALRPATPEYQAEFISADLGTGPWCPGETRNISVTIRNAGTATWTDGPLPGTPDINIGVRWNPNGGNWTDFHVRTNANNVAPGETRTYTFSLTASNNSGSGYTTPLAPGLNNIRFDVVNEGQFWFRNRPGNSEFISSDITISALPDLTDMSEITCSGTGFSVTPQDGINGNIPAGTTYTWTAPAVTAGLVTGGVAGSGSSITGNLVNTSSIAQPVAYTVTPITNGCPGDPFQVQILLNPAGDINTINREVCSEDSFSITPVDVTDGVVPANTSYTWTAPTVTGGLIGGIAGSGSAITGTLRNPTNAPQTATYTVTPITGSCVGADFTVIVTVNPEPAITDLSTASCSNQPFSVTPTNGTDGLIPTGTTYAWSAPSVPAGITGGAAGTGTELSGTLTNTTNAPLDATYTVTPTSGTCVGDDFTVTVTVNPSPVIPTQTPTICSGDSFTVSPTNGGSTIVPANTSYTWTVADNPDVTGESAQANPQSDIAQFLTNLSPIPQTVTYTVTPRSGVAGNCEGNPFTILVTVNPTPILDSPITTERCSDASNTYTATSATPGTTFSWTRATVTGISNTADNGTGASATETLINTTLNPIDVVYEYTLTANGCTNTQNVTVTVNPTPELSSSLSPPDVCSNGLFTYTPNSVTSGATYAWTRAAVTGISNPAITTAQTTNPNEVLVNTTTDPIDVTYTYTITANGCSNTHDVIVTVNPTPELNSTLNPGPICSDATFSYTPGSDTPGANFTWTRAAVSGISNAAVTTAQSGDPNEVLVNTTNNPIEVVYAFTISANGCTNTQNVRVTVNPTPRLNSSLPAICSDSPFTYTPTSAVSGASFAWTRAAIAGISNPVDNGTGNINETLINTTPDPIDVVYEYTIESNGCSFTEDVTVTVNPTPELNTTLTPPAVCSNSVFSYTRGSDTPGVSITWTREAVAGISNAAVTTPQSSNPNETLVNTTANPIDVVYRFTLTANGCSNTQDVSVTVNPSPVLSSVSSLEICSDDNLIYTATSLTGGTNFSWTRAAVAGISNAAASGSSDTINETLINTTADPIDVIYVFTLEANGCTTTQDVTVTVNPSPVLTSPTSLEVCDGEEFSFTATSATTGITYLWTRDVVSGISNSAGSGSGATVTETLINTTSAPIDVVYEFSLSANGCDNIQFVYVTVNPTPTLDSSLTPPAVCGNEAFTYTPSSATGGATFTWTRGAVTGISNAAVTSPQSSNPNEVLVNTTPDPIEVIFIYEVTANACTNTQEVRVTVNPAPDISAITDDVCSGSSFTVNPIHGTDGIVPTSTNYTWTVADNSNVTGESDQSTPQPIISQTLTNTSGTPQDVVYTVTPISGTCVGDPFTVTVTVNGDTQIDTQPSGNTFEVCFGDSFSPISVVASGANGLTYQWFSNSTQTNTGGTAVPGATSATFTPPSSAEGENYYYVVVTGPCTSVTSDPSGRYFVSPPVTAVVTDVDTTPQTICPGDSFSPLTFEASGANLSYQWYSNTTASTTGGTEIVGADLSSFIPPNTDFGPVYYYALASSDCGTVTSSISGVFEITGSTTTLADQTLCVDTPLNPVITHTTTGTTGISNDGVAGANGLPPGVSASWNAGVITITGTPTSSAGSPYNYSIPLIGACGTEVATGTITVNPKAEINDISETICTDGSFNITPADGTDGVIPAGTTYEWTIPSMTAGLTGGVAGSGNSIIGTLVNSTNTVQTATYTVTPTSGTCLGTSFTVTITVNPSPSIPDQSTTICDEESFTVSPANGGSTRVPAGTTYTWTVTDNPNVIGESAEATAQANISQALTNNSNIPQNVVYTVTPTAGTCIGAPFTVTVTVNPDPEIPDLTETICSGSAFNLSPSNGGSTIVPTGTSYTWTVLDNPNITGESDQATGQSNISQTLTNLTDVPQTVEYTVTPISGAVGNCVGDPFTVTVTVNPSPVIPAQTATICSGEAFTVSPTNGGGTIVPSGTQYTWTVANNTDVTGESTQTSPQASISQALTNTSNTPQTVTYTVTPQSGTDGNCAGDSFTVTVLVNPTPNLTSTLTPAEICSDGTFTYTLTSNVSGANFTWTRAEVTGISNAAVTSPQSSDPNEVLVNTTNSPIDVVYTYVIEANGCSNTQEVTVRVKPTPTLSSTLTPTEICGNSTFSYTPTSDVSGATFTWTRAAVAGISNPAITSPQSSSPNETLINTTDSPIDVVYEFTTTASGCSTTENVTVRVNPRPTLSSTLSPADICSGSAFTYTPTSASGTASFTWTRPAVAGITNAAITTAQNTDPNEVLVNATPNPIDVIYVFTIDDNGCTNTENVRVTVNPTPELNSSLTPAAICTGTEFNYAASTLTSGTTITWTRPAVSGISNAAISTPQNSNPSETLINTTDLPIDVVYSYTLTASGCSNTQNVTVRVNPSPTLSSSLTPPAVCAGAAFNYTPTSDTPSTTFSWTRAGVTGISNPAGSGSVDINETLINTTSSPIDVVYALTTTANACSTTENVTVRVDPVPAITDQFPGNSNFDVRYDICSGQSFSFDPQDGANGIIPTGTTYSWVVTRENGNLSGANDGSGTSISGTITNSDTRRRTADYLVTPSYNGCDGAPFVIRVRVQPEPNVAPISSPGAVCNGSPVGPFTFTGSPVTLPNGNPISTVYNWANDNPAIGLAASGTGNIPSFTAINNGVVPVTANITVTPEANGCDGPSETFTITVNPTPRVTVVPDYCVVGGQVQLIANSNLAGTTYLWNTGETTSSILVDLSGQYEVTATAPNGCSTTESISIAEELVLDGSFTNFDPNNLTFNTGYTYLADNPTANNELIPEGRYGVGTNANNYHPNFWGNQDRTNNSVGPRNMMIINGFPGSNNTTIWEQTVVVEPNTEYYFTASAISLNAVPPYARLRFEVNGVQVGTIANLTAGVNNNSNNGWQRFYSDPVWNSGTASGPITIRIVNLEPAAGGNDFALDDISFGTLKPFIVLTSGVGTDDQTVCQDSPIVPITYNAGSGIFGPQVTGLPTGITPVWNGVELQFIGSPTESGVFDYTVSTTGTCAPTSVTGTITVRATPTAGTIAADQTVCEGQDPEILTSTTNGTGESGSTIEYRWESNTNLTTPNWTVIGSQTGATYNPPALSQTTQFRRITLATLNGLTCESEPTGPIQITVQNPPTPGSIAGDQTVCNGDDPTAFTSTVAGSGDGSISYRWERAVSPFSSWTSISGETAAIYDAPAGLTETTRFRRVTISDLNGTICESVPTAPVEVTVSAVPTAGSIDSAQQICEGEDPVAFTSVTDGTGTGSIFYIWESSVAPFTDWTEISSANLETYDSPALTETTQFRRITASSLNGVTCLSAPTTPVEVTVLQAIDVDPVNPDPPLCLDVPQPVTIIHTSTGADSITNEGVAGANGLPLGVSAAFNSSTGDVTISGTPTEVGVFNYNIPLTGGCGSISATGTITVDDPSYPISNIEVNNPAVGSTPPYVSTFTVFGPELTPGDYDINYSTSGANAVADQTITVTVTTAGQFTFQSLPYSNEGTTILTLNSIQGVADQCPFSVPTNNTAPFGINCSTEYLEADGDATYSIGAGISEVTIEVFGDGGNPPAETFPAIPGQQIYLVFDGLDIFATQVPDSEPVADRLAQAIISTTGPNGRFVITYDCTTPPPCSGTGDVYQYTDAEGYTVIRVTGDCSSWTWSAPEGLDEFEVLVVGGGGGGGFGDAAGGGGGGGVFYQNYTGITMNGNPGLQGAVFQVSPGGQGIGSTNPNQQGGDGEGSSFTGPSFDYAGGNTFSNISVAGGGGGGSSSSSPTSRAGRDGASGGGGAAFGGDTSGGGFASADGNEGGQAFTQGSSASGAGGGGATTGGGDGSGDASLMSAGNGGNGFIQGISGEDLFYGAGGGGTSSGATVNEPGLGGSPYSDGASQFYAGGRGNNTGVGLPATTYGSGGGAGRTGGSNGFQGVVYIRYPNFRILPVEFLYFEAEHNEALRSGDLTWATAQEWENDRFEIQRSLNATRDWEIIGEVEGAGYSDQVQMYDFRDLNLPPAGGDIFYRLKQYDEDGDFTYSETRAIQVEPLPGITRWRVYPNPTTGDPINFALLKPSLYEDEEIMLRIISPTGDYVIIEVDDMTKMGAQVTQYFRNLAAGVYTIEISWGEQIEYHKVILKR